MDTQKASSFQSLNGNVGNVRFGRKTLLLPQMNRTGSHLFTAAFRAFGIEAKVMDTYKGLELGLQCTSGKECYPCQVTIGDILHHLKGEQERLGPAFNPEDYIYFIPEADGPCRFGMYNKYQRLVLDSFPGLDRVKIASPTTQNAFSFDGMLDRRQVLNCKKALYFSVVVAEILDRLLLRVRPYERESGMADEFIERSMHVMRTVFESHAGRMEFSKILDRLMEIAAEGKTLINPDVPPKPLIGIVGEIYLRSHVQSNQDLIRVLERYGAEVVNASAAEWFNWVSYDGLRTAKREFRLALKQLRLDTMAASLRKMIDFGGDLLYKEFRQRKTYKKIKPILDLEEGHKVSHLEDILKEDDVFSFHIGTEACLSIAGILGYAASGYNGVVNVYPFTCMPSMTASAIAKPLMNRQRVPYLDVPCDSGVQPGREAAIRTFMYQALQHFQRHGRRASAKHHSTMPISCSTTATPLVRAAVTMPLSPARPEEG
jgi:predicted nucleotide-binding protein (sugar kinase/HSP70/actin superfamily)